VCCASHNPLLLKKISSPATFSAILSGSYRWLRFFGFTWLASAVSRRIFIQICGCDKPRQVLSTVSAGSRFIDSETRSHSLSFPAAVSLTDGEFDWPPIRIVIFGTSGMGAASSKTCPSQYHHIHVVSWITAIQQQLITIENFLVQNTANCLDLKNKSERPCQLEMVYAVALVIGTSSKKVNMIEPW